MNLSLIVLFSAYIPNHVVNFTIITKLLKWIYRIVYEIFLAAYPEIKSYIRHWCVLYIFDLGSWICFVIKLVMTDYEWKWMEMDGKPPLLFLFSSQLSQRRKNEQKKHVLLLCKDNYNGVSLRIKWQPA